MATNQPDDRAASLRRVRLIRNKVLETARDLSDYAERMASSNCGLVRALGESARNFAVDIDNLAADNPEFNHCEAWLDQDIYTSSRGV